MDMQQIIERAERNIRNALEDYGAHTNQREVLDDVSGSFIRTLARDSAYAKQGLRELFSKSPVWDEELDALVINGTRTHDPDYDRIRSLARDILRPAFRADNQTGALLRAGLDSILDFFGDPKYLSESQREACIGMIKTIAPKAYAPSKKLSRVFKAICQQVGVADESAGSEFQRLYAQFADELTSKKISFKLYVSINPGHFLTMSNPKYDQRGNTLTSCHSFNSTEYDYNCGCAGYARDEVTFIVFTVADPKDAETLNNRKTTRQIFAYRPGNGVLMQSRMYNTAGGVYGAAEDSKLYRDLVQREISMLENAPNLWKTAPYLNGRESYVDTHPEFGGYADWTYSDFDGKVSIRNDHAEDGETITVGEAGLCIRCGCEISSGLYCDDCKGCHDCYCDHCEGYYSETFPVRDEDGNEIYVCDRCRDEYYTYCDECHDYHPNNRVHYVDGKDVCDDCLDEYYFWCDHCEEYHHRDYANNAHARNGNEIEVCSDCLSEHYFYCEKCGEYYHADCIAFAYNANGEPFHVCENCEDEIDECPHCGDRIEIKDDGTCPSCGAVVEDEEEAV